jgi:ribosomal protein L16 Arg81 hydroxylase
MTDPSDSQRHPSSSTSHILAG